MDNGTGGNSAEASASLAARRARLRGALAKASSYSPDPSSADPQSAAAPAPNNTEEEPSLHSFADSPESYSQADAPAVTEVEVAEESAVNVYGVSLDEAQVSEVVEAEEFIAPAAVVEEPVAEIEEPPVAEALPVVAPPPTEEPLVPPVVEAEIPEPPVATKGKTKTRGLKNVTPVANLEPEETADATLGMIRNIDQSLHFCANNLAALQNLSNEQTEVLKGLTESLQNKALLEIGRNLSGLSDSLSAALEPMKAMGELIPALDQLIVALDGGEADKTDRLTSEQLVGNLADQLSAGLIDPWTFKCAYMAIYPSDHPADLLHRLVELLGSQRLSGDLFRDAYEAVQAAEPPNKTLFSSVLGENSEYLQMLPDDAVKAQLVALERAHREMQQRQDEREREFGQILEEKEIELNQRIEELNSRYLENSDSLSSREEEFKAVLESKDMELIEKESELNMLRMQMEELRSQTEEMIRDIQKAMQEELQKIREEQAAKVPPAAPTPAQSFFEAAPQAPKESFAAEAPSQSFMPVAEKVPEMPAPVQAEAFQPAFQPAQPAFQPAQQPAAIAQPAPVGGSAPTQQLAKPAQTGGAFGSQSGSYGSGVRAQVFEVIVRQALAGAPWREICAGPMQVNNISPDEVEAEVKRRQSVLGKS
ncbi:MAG: hypothetical protein K2W82_02510 [Candidatus Obscuribacterales bacterium]|nr:hypothetical protein [Candidatus Obscuribacterales bacterium]